MGNGSGEFIDGHLWDEPLPAEALFDVLAGGFGAGQNEGPIVVKFPTELAVDLGEFRIRVLYLGAT